MRKIFILLFLCVISTSVFAQNNIFVDYLNRKINETPLTFKGNELMRKHAIKYVDLYNSGLMYDFYTVDPIAQSVSWNINILPSNLKSQYWGWDNMKEIKRNVMGQINAEDVDTYNYLLTLIVLDFIKTYPKPISQISEEKFYIDNITDLNDYIINERFGNSDNFEYQFSQLYTLH